MAKLKRVKVIIRDEEFNLTPRQLINKLSKLDHWDYEDFFENNPTDNFNHFACKEKLIDQIIEDLYTNYVAVPRGRVSVNIRGNQLPGEDALDKIIILRSKGWSITYQ